MLRCENCCYYWQEDSETFATCHWDTSQPWDAPCEEDEYWDESADDYLYDVEDF